MALGAAAGRPPTKAGRGDCPKLSGRVGGTSPLLTLRSKITKKYFNRDHIQVNEVAALAMGLIGA